MLRIIIIPEIESMIGPGFVVDLIVASTQQLQQLNLHMQELPKPLPVDTTTLTTRDQDTVTVITPAPPANHKHKHQRRRTREVAERPVVVRAASSVTFMFLGAAGVYSGVRGILQVARRPATLHTWNICCV